jgi:hypothetical protein
MNKDGVGARWTVGGTRGWVLPAIVVWTGVFAIVMGLGSDQKIRAWVGFFITLSGILIYLLHRLMMLYEELEAINTELIDLNKGLLDLNDDLLRAFRECIEATP